MQLYNTILNIACLASSSLIYVLLGRLCLLQLAAGVTSKRSNMNLENFISPCNCFFSFSVQFPLFCQCTHKTFERQYMHSLSAYLLWETVKCCVWVEIQPLVWVARFFSTVRCECRWVISTLLMPISFSVNSALRM